MSIIIYECASNKSNYQKYWVVFRKLVFLITDTMDISIIALGMIVAVVCEIKLIFF